MTEAQKCNTLSDEMSKLNKMIYELRKKFEGINFFELDAENDKEWDSFVVEAWIKNLRTAEKLTEI